MHSQNRTAKILFRSVLHRVLAQTPRSAESGKDLGGMIRATKYRANHTATLGALDPAGDSASLSAALLVRQASNFLAGPGGRSPPAFVHQGVIGQLFRRDMRDTFVDI